MVASAPANPYAAPVSSDPAPVASGCIVDRGALCLPVRGARLPTRCVRCNAETPLRMNRKVSRHHSALYFCILVSPLLYAILALTLRKSVSVEFSLCEQHRRRRQWALAAGWTAPITCFVVSTGFAEFGAANVGILVAMLLTIGQLLGALCGATLLVPLRIDGERIWLRAGLPFMVSFTRRSAGAPVGERAVSPALPVT